MGIRKRFIILLSLVSFIIMGLFWLFLLVEKKYIERAKNIELEHVKNYSEKLLDIFSHKIKILAIDYTYWDEFVSFMETKDISWARKYLDVALDIYEADFISVYDLEGNIVYFTSRNKLIDKDPLQGLLDIKTIKDIFRENWMRDFFINTSYGLCEIWGTTINSTDDPERKKAYGYFFTGRIWDKEILEELGSLSRLKYSFYFPPKESITISEKPYSVYFTHELKDFKGRTVVELIVRSRTRFLELFYKMTKLIPFFTIVLVFLTLLISYLITIWVNRPLVLITEAYNKKDTSLLGKIKTPSKEFSQLMQLITLHLHYENELNKEIENRKNTEAELRRINRVSSILRQVSQILIKVRDEEELFREVCRVCVEVGNYRMVWIGWIDKEKKLVKPVVSWGYLAGYLDDIIVSIDEDSPEGKGPSGIVYREGKPYVCNDIENDPCMAYWRERALKRNYRSSATFPIRLRSEIVALLKLYSDQKHFFIKEEVSLLEELARDLSYALEFLDNEEKRKLYEKELEETIKELKSTQTKLLQSVKLSALGQLVAGVAHEINNPLVSVMNNLQLIKMILEQKGGISPEELQKILSTIEESVQHCKKLIQNMLSFSRATAGLFEILSLNEIIDKVIPMVEFEYKVQGVNIERKLDENLPPILGDRQLLQQMLLDILNNSLWAIQKKTKEGGTITISTQFLPEERKIMLIIADTGIGISEENLPRIFEPFFTTKEVGEGTGLGLAIVYDIIKRHNGDVKVEIKVNEGTTFKIEFPITNVSK